MGDDDGAEVRAFLLPPGIFKFFIRIAIVATVTIVIDIFFYIFPV